MDVSSLTVPKLKARCKELRLTGYSKLGRTALLQKLGAATVTPTSLDVSASPTESLVSTASSTLLPAPIFHQGHEDKRSKTTSDSTNGDQRLSKQPSLTLAHFPSSVQSKTPLPSSASASQAAIPSMPATSAQCAVKVRSTRFLSLVPSQTATIRRLSSDRQNSIDSSSSQDLRYLDFGALKLPSLPLNAIGFPPSLRQRDSAEVWSIVLLMLADEDRRRCALVSRTVRYAGTLLCHSVSPCPD